MKRKEAISVGVGMMPVMGVALIIVSTGIERGMFGAPGGILANQIRTATLFLIFASCFLTPLFLKKSLASPLFKQIGKGKTKPSFYHHPHCAECFSALRLDPTTNKWYCDICQNYPEIQKKAPRYKPQGSEKTDRYIKYIIGAGTILLCGYVIQSSPSMDVIEKASALIGIFIGTTLGFFIVRYLFSNQKTTN
jgi:hypothetical protein